MGGTSGIEHLGIPLFVLAAISVMISSIMTFRHVHLHLKNYRQPHVQRLVIRILFMVPIYGISSCAGLLTPSPLPILEGIRDIYEAFVIYTFFHLLLNLIGGEREILASHRLPTHHLFPLRLFVPKRTVDIGDPIQFLNLRRGILQFAILKPLFFLLTLLLREVGAYHEGEIAWGSGYMWVSLLYNISVSWSLYCLALFYVACADLLKPFRPMPKFLCVKAIIFFTFWQGMAISLMVKIGIIPSGEHGENIAAPLQDLLISLEMIPAALSHWSAFSHKDYITSSQLAARLPYKYALKDSLSSKDVYLDVRHTLRGTTFSYDTFSPAEAILARLNERQRSRMEEILYTYTGWRRRFRSNAIVTREGYVEPNKRRGLVEQRVVYTRKVPRNAQESHDTGITAGHGPGIGSSMSSPAPSTVVHMGGPDVDSDNDDSDPLTALLNSQQEPSREQVEDIIVEEEEIFFQKASEEFIGLEFDEDDELDHMYRAARRTEVADHGFPVFDTRETNHIYRGKPKGKARLLQIGDRAHTESVDEQFVGRNGTNRWPISTQAESSNTSSDLPPRARQGQQQGTAPTSSRPKSPAGGQKSRCTTPSFTGPQSSRTQGTHLPGRNGSKSPGRRKSATPRTTPTPIRNPAPTRSFRMANGSKSLSHKANKETSSTASPSTPESQVTSSLYGYDSDGV